MKGVKLQMKTVPGVTLTEKPKNWMILQRNERGVSDIFLRGTWTIPDWFPKETVFTVQARIVREDTQAPLTPAFDWQDAQMSEGSNEFAITLSDVPQGGLYRIETRIRRTHAADRRALRGDCVHHIGVGDIYVIAGQSNASGTGKGMANDGPELGVHLFANDEQWRLATHPLEDSTNSLHPATLTGIVHGHSPWLAFGKYLLRETKIPIGLIPTALGGSSITRWVEDEGCQGDLLENMEDMIAKVGGCIAGVLWYQGESDADPIGVSHYGDRFRSFVRTVRSFVGSDNLPVFTGQLNRWADPSANDSGWSGMRNLQWQLSRELPHVHLVVTIDCPMSDAIHNNAQSNVVIGERFAASALEHVYHRPVMSSFPTLSCARFLDESKTAIELQFDHVSGEWMALSADPEDFLVEDENGAIPIAAISMDPSDFIHLGLERSASKDAIVHALYGANPNISLHDDLGRCITPFSVKVVTE